MQCLIKGSPVFYEEYGIGTPLLCIHGFPEDHRVLAGCIEPIIDNHEGLRRIYVDLPGMGRSPAHPLVRNADDMLDVLVSFVNQVIGDHAYLLFGQSYGGYLSLGLAYRSTHQMDGLFLLCPCTVSDRTARTLPSRSIVKQEAIALLNHEQEEAFADFLSYATVVTRETWARYQAEVLPGLSCADSGFIAAYQESGYGFSFELEMRAKLCFDAPTCLLTGAMDDCVGYEDAYKLFRSFSKCTFTVLGSAGHNLQIEYPHRFAYAFRDWLHRAAPMLP